MAKKTNDDKRNQGSPRFQKKVPSTSDDCKKLTPTQAEVLFLHSVEFLTSEAIAFRRHTTVRAVNKTLARLKKIGALKGLGNLGSSKLGGVSQKRSSDEMFWRLHNLHFVIKPFYFYPRYERMRDSLGGYSIEYRDWTVTFHEEVIEVREKKFHDFRDKDKFKSLAKGSDSFNRTLRELESKYGFIAGKEGKANIRLVDHHLAHVNSDFSKNVADDEHILIKGFDGKVWLCFDKSTGIKEEEYVHSKRAVSDSEIMSPMLNEVREHYIEYKEHLTLKSVMALIKDLTVQNQETACGLNAVVELIKPKKLDEEVKGSFEKPHYVG